jgi:hypothetical protein
MSIAVPRTPAIVLVLPADRMDAAIVPPEYVPRRRTSTDTPTGNAL